MTYYLGIDIGTTATKSVAFSEKGEIIAMETIGYDMHHPQTGWMEQDPDEIFAAVVNGINALVPRISGTPAFVCFSTAMHSLIAVDENGFSKWSPGSSQVKRSGSGVPRNMTVQENIAIQAVLRS